MTKKERENLIHNTKTVAYYSGWGGLEIKDIEHGIDDYIIFVSGTFYGRPAAHRSLIHYETAIPYFNYNGHRIRFDECLRV